MKDGAILSNSGHFNVEIEIAELKKMSKGRRMIRDFVEEFTLRNNRRVYLLGEGRLINLAAAERAPFRGYGYEFCKPGPLRGIYRKELQETAKEGLQRSGADRQRHCFPEAEGNGYKDRYPDTGAERNIWQAGRWAHRNFVIGHVNT